MKKKSKKINEEWKEKERREDFEKKCESGDYGKGDGRKKIFGAARVCKGSKRIENMEKRNFWSCTCRM